MVMQANHLHTDAKRAAKTWDRSSFASHTHFQFVAIKHGFIRTEINIKKSTAHPLMGAPDS
eukprot:4776489-Karenia_brevis.AAC.1